MVLIKVWDAKKKFKKNLNLRGVTFRIQEHVLTTEQKGRFVEDGWWHKSLIPKIKPNT